MISQSRVMEPGSARVLGEGGAELGSQQPWWWWQGGAKAFRVCPASLISPPVNLRARSGLALGEQGPFALASISAGLK